MLLTILTFMRSFCQGMTMGDLAGTNPLANTKWLATKHELLLDQSKNIRAIRVHPWQKKTPPSSSVYIHTGAKGAILTTPPKDFLSSGNVNRITLAIA